VERNWELLEMSRPARFSIEHHTPTYKERFRTEYSDPHLAVFQALIDAGITIGGSEEWLLCEPCEQPGCHHRWKPDIRIAERNILVEVHRPDGDADDQEARKHCLENSGWIVVMVTDKDPPSLAVERVQLTLKLAEAVTE